MRFIPLIILAFLPEAAFNQAQEKEILKATGWGSLSGKVTSANDKKGVADAVIFLKAPKGFYFPIHDDDKKRPDINIQIPPGRTFNFRMLVHYPHYFDGNKNVPTGQRIVLKGDDSQDHSISFRGVNQNTITYLKAGTEIADVLKPAALPVQMQSNVYQELRANVYVADNPYYAITDEDGSFKILRVPAGVEISLMAWHEEVGWLLTNKGKTMTFHKDKKTTFSFDMKTP